MAKIFPFRGITYNSKKVSAPGSSALGGKDLSLVLTQPYDKITDELQGKYYERHKYNLVRITKGKDLPDDNQRNNKYTRAREFLDNWLRAKVLVQDKEPCIYAYYQEYKVDGEKKIRKGFIAVARLQDFGKGGVHAHEKTLLKPKQDRLSMMRSVGGSTGQIFMLYADPKGEINKLLDRSIHGKRLALQAKDDYGTIHKLWKMKAPNVVKKIIKLMDKKEIFIADGHHRYETALNYRNEMRVKKARCMGNESYENRMMTFINMDDKGLTILPTYRLVYGLTSFAPDDFIKKLRKYFWIKVYSFSNPSDQVKVRAELLKDLKTSNQNTHCLGLVMRGFKYYLLVLRDEKVMDKIAKETNSPAWKRLDVTILHTLVLERLLRISKENLAREERVVYSRYADEVFESIQAGKYQIGFLLNPTRIDELKKVALRGERMPQKSTDFYPKLLSGIVISKIAYTQKAI